MAELLLDAVKTINWVVVGLVVTGIFALLAGLCIISARDDQDDEDHHGVDKARRS
jgi:hypothetical protein